MYEIVDRVRASQTAGNGRMTLTSAMELIQDCSVLWLESEPSFREYIFEKNLGMFLISRQADIVRLPVYGEKITVKTSIYDCNRFMGYRNTVLYGENGLPCLMTWGLGLFVNLDTGKTTRIPQNEIEKINLDRKFKMEYLDRKISVPKSFGRYSNAIVVKNSDIDFYQHMNNVKYIEIALELLPVNFRINRLRIEYKKSARLGDILYPCIIEGYSGCWYILLLDNWDDAFAIMEFS